MELIREACVESRAEIDAACAGGARRIELCARLDVGGLSPADDMLLYALQRGMNVAAMARVRADFSAPPEDREALIQEIRRLGAGGAQALVFGFLNSAGALDLPILEALREEARNVKGSPACVFHMAFDELDEAAQLNAIDQLAGLGFARILTKGGRGKAGDNLERLCRLREYAEGKITILAGGGVTDGNYRAIARQTGIREFHGRKLGLTP